MSEIKIGGPGALTIMGWRLWYSDGLSVDSQSLKEWPDGSVSNLTWADAPADDVQALVVFYNETYTQWDSEGKRLQTFPYRKVYCQEDYYWEFGAGTAEEAKGKPNIKRGKLIADEVWWDLYNKHVHPDLVF